MNVVDVALVVLLLLCGLRGAWRGIFREGFGFAALVLGLLAAFRGAAAGAVWLAEQLPEVELNGSAQLGVSFVVIFLAVSTLVNLVGVTCDQLFGRGALRLVSRLAGVLFAIGKGAVVLAFVLLFLHIFPILPGIETELAGSRLARPMVAAAGGVLRTEWAVEPAPDRSA